MRSLRKRRAAAARPVSVSFFACACSWGISVSSGGWKPLPLKSSFRSATQLLECPAANAKDGKRRGDGVVVAEIDIRIEVGLILGRGFLIESR